MREWNHTQIIILFNNFNMNIETNKALRHLCPKKPKL